MMLKKTFKIFYWTFACLASIFYMGFKAHNSNSKLSNQSSSELIIFTSNQELKTNSMADLWLAFADDESKLLEDEERSVELLASVLEQSLSNAVDKSLSKMTSPKEDFLNAFKNIFKLESKVKYSEYEVNNIEADVIKAFNALDYVRKNEVVVDQAYIRELCLDNLFSVEDYNNLIEDLSILDNVKSLREFLLNAILCSKDPYKKLSEIIDNSAIKVHNSTGTFMVNQIASDGVKFFDTYYQNSINKFVNQPRWNLWAPASSADKGVLARTLNLVGLGGTIRSVVVETRASNIVRANGMLKGFMKDLKSHA